MKNILCILALFAAIPCFAQIETGTHVFWQPGTRLTFEMFQGAPTDSAQVKKVTDVNIFFEIAAGFWNVLDVPASRRDWNRGKKEKPHFCAALDKKASYWIVRDSTELKYAQLIWDLVELSTRISRKSLAEYDSALNEGLSKAANGAIALHFMTAVNDGKQFGREATFAFFGETVTTRDEEAFSKWRNFVDERLQALEAYATREEEIRRFISGTPETGYARATALTPDFKDRGTIPY